MLLSVSFDHVDASIDMHVFIYVFDMTIMIYNSNYFHRGRDLDP